MKQVRPYKTDEIMAVAEAALEKYFTPVTCFLVFNVLALLGNIATEFVRRVSFVRLASSGVCGKSSLWIMKRAFLQN